jgi:hypothetical protein
MMVMELAEMRRSEQKAVDWMVEVGCRNTATVFLEEAYNTSILRRHIVRIQETAVQV